MASELIKTIIYVCLVSYSYVASIYVYAPKGDRNLPHIIRSRIIRVSIITLVNMLMAPIILTKILKTSSDYSVSLSFLGLTNPFTIREFSSCAKTLLLFIILFMGPVVQNLVYFNFHQTDSLESFRDFFIAPLTEEFIYTALTTGSFAPFFNSPESVKIICLTTPLLFGMAHLHHAYGIIKRGVPIMQAISICLFQLIYTTLFGYLTNCVFINSGSVWCCFIAHSFCNFMGFPDLRTKNGLLIDIMYWSLLYLGLWGFGKWFNILTITDSMLYIREIR